MSRGIQRERQVKRLLEDDGYWCSRAAGSLGDADVIALKAGEPPRLIEVKSTVRPFSHFGPADRAELSAAAVKAGATPELCWWPSRAQPEFIGAADWPAARA